MRKLSRSLLSAAALAGMLSGCTKEPDNTMDLPDPGGDQSQPADLSQSADLSGRTTLSFFITSETGSANLGGLTGADARCKRLAEAAGVMGKQWAAYLSATAMGAQAAVNARDRIGRGPWYNANGAKVADSVDDLHGNSVNLNKMTALDERGRQVNGRGDTPNQHDILTGSTLDGRVNGTSTCANWTSDAATGPVATVGHHDRDGGGANPMSWNSAHDSRGCSAEALVGSGGAGRFYCFAVQ